MATAYVFNGFGKFEHKDDLPSGELGVLMKYAGNPMWFPYGKTTAIPNFTLREVDHDKSAATRGDEGTLTYRTVIVPGDRIVNEMTEGQIPIQIKETGIIRVEGKATGQAITVDAGTDEDGTRLFTEVPEKLATMTEMERAFKLADAYKRDEIARYFQSKRERMAGGQGRLQPSRMTRLFMEELNIEDIDDVTAHAKSSGMTKDGLADLAKVISESTGDAIAQNLMKAVQSVRASTKAQFSPGAGSAPSSDPSISDEERARRIESGKRLAAARAAKRAKDAAAKEEVTK